MDNEQATRQPTYGQPSPAPVQAPQYRFNFKTIERGKNLSQRGQELVNVLRLTAKYFSIGHEAGAQFRRNVFQRGDSKWSYVKLGFEVDGAAKAIRVVNDETNGFATKLVPETGTLYGNVPVNLKRAGMPNGDYVNIEGTNIFVLAE